MTHSENRTSSLYSTGEFEEIDVIWIIFTLFAAVLIGGLAGLVWWTTDGFSSTWDEP